ncbi:MAG: helix-turn-helix domain-containing protein [Solimonas sp.]
MDSLITAAARALAHGDPLAALKRVALRNDPPALALRGIAAAQLGDLPRARTLVRSAARAFGAREPLARARCVVAEAEIALAARELGWPAKSLDAARAVLEAHGDRRNAAHARHLELRRLVLIGRLDQAERLLATLDPAPLPPPLRATHELLAAGIALRRLHMRAAREALARAQHAAQQSGIPALQAEVQRVAELADAPAARLLEHGAERLLALDEVEALLASPALVIDACRHSVGSAGHIVRLARRPVLFTLLRLLGEAWPDDATRDALVLRAFRARRADESHRARLRVEMGRLRAALKPLAELRATPQGFVLVPREAREVSVLAPPLEDANAAVLACLADGEAWSSSALALALGESQRSTQRALDALAASGKVQSHGKGRALRWMMPPLHGASAGFTTALLLTAPLPAD